MAGRIIGVKTREDVATGVYGEGGDDADETTLRVDLRVNLSDGIVADTVMVRMILFGDIGEVDASITMARF